MLPPGHIAAGYLAGYTFLKIVDPSISAQQQAMLLIAGATSGFIPDLDFFYAFFKVKSFTIQNNKVNHRYFVSHTPVVWFVPSVLIIALAPGVFYKLLGAMLWIGSWSHFLLDSLGGEGIKWLWPLKKQNYSLKNTIKFPPISEPSFVKFWLKFLAQYPKTLPITFVCEILVIITALIVLSTTLIFN